MTNNKVTCAEDIGRLFCFYLHNLDNLWTTFLPYIRNFIVNWFTYTEPPVPSLADYQDRIYKD